jgi:hypothetical protein
MLIYILTFWLSQILQNSRFAYTGFFNTEHLGIKLLTVLFNNQYLYLPAILTITVSPQQAMCLIQIYR